MLGVRASIWFWEARHNGGVHSIVTSAMEKNSKDWIKYKAPVDDMPIYTGWSH